jgi:UDP-N-acetylglucosamine diphosphorylase/glucosamine-1-phosphate N-acetyltransferase
MFEDILARNFLPLTFFRPVYDLRCGTLSMRERIQRLVSARTVTLYCRQTLAPLVAEENPDVEVNKISSDPCLFVNGRCIMTRSLAKVMLKVKGDTIFMVGNDVVGARLSGENLIRSRSELYTDALDLSTLTGVPLVEVEARLVQFPWDLIYANETQIADDFRLLTENGKRVVQKGDVHKSAVLVGKKDISIGKKSTVGPGSVLDASAGSIYIGNDVRIYPTAVIEGPCFVGDGSTIKIGAKIYGGTSIGPVCKVGGEVVESIFHSHVNKQHDGFVGHSYLGAWVNLGAGTTTSNLKNTYGTVKVPVGGEIVDSGKMFVGLIAGDHVKTGINATLDTGTVIGVGSNLYGTGIPPKFVPSFSWGTAERLETYDLNKALAVAARVMSRRDVTVTPAYEDLFRNVFTMTTDERSKIRV